MREFETTRQMAAWLVPWLSGGPPSYLRQVYVDAVNITDRVVTLYGLAGTDAALSVYELPPNGFDLEIKSREGGRADDYENGRRFAYLTRCRTVRKYSDPIIELDEEHAIKLYADIECDAVEFFLDRRE